MPRGWRWIEGQPGLMGRAWPTRVCMCVHVLPVSLQFDFTPSFRPSEKRAGGVALGSAWHWLCRLTFT